MLSPASVISGVISISTADARSLSVTFKFPFSWDPSYFLPGQGAARRSLHPRFHVNETKVSVARRYHTALDADVERVSRPPRAAWSLNSNDGCQSDHRFSAGSRS
jgi:hypothetical protein